MITISPEEWANLVRRVEAAEAAAEPLRLKPQPAIVADLHCVFHGHSDLSDALIHVYNLGVRYGRANP